MDSVLADPHLLKKKISLGDVKPKTIYDYIKRTSYLGSSLLRAGKTMIFSIDKSHNVGSPGHQG